MEEFSIYFYIVVGLAALFVGFSKGGLGGMLGSVPTPLVALVVPVDLAIGLVLPMFMIGDLFAVSFHWRHWNGRLVMYLIPGAALGVVLGTAVITRLDTEALRTGLGIVIWLFILYKVFEKRIVGSLKYEGQNWHGLIAGTLTGFFSMVNTGAPPMGIFLLMQRVVPQVFIATAALFFFILNWIKVPSYFYAGLFDFQLILRASWAILLIPVGAWIGRRVVDRLSRETFERVILFFLAITGSILIFS
jgi:uncharacterized membrane protein YfcA